MHAIQGEQLTRDIGREVGHAIEVQARLPVLRLDLVKEGMGIEDGQVFGISPIIDYVIKAGEIGLDLLHSGSSFLLYKKAACFCRIDIFQK